MQKIFFDKNHWFQLLSTKNNWTISLLLISSTLHSLSLGHSIIDHVIFLFAKNNLWLSRKTLSLLLTKSHNARKFGFSACSLTSFLFFRFRFFVFFFVPLQNVLTKSPYVTNIWIISFRRKVTWFTTAYIPNRCLFSVACILLTKRRMRVFYRSSTVAFVIWHSREQKI